MLSRSHLSKSQFFLLRTLNKCTEISIGSPVLLRMELSYLPPRNLSFSWNFSLYSMLLIVDCQNSSRRIFERQIQSQTRFFSLIRKMPLNFSSKHLHQFAFSVSCTFSSCRSIHYFLSVSFDYVRYYCS